MVRGIQRCIAADREFDDKSVENLALDEPGLGNLEDSLPEPLDLVSNKDLSVSHVSKMLGFGDAQEIQSGGNS